MSIEKIIKTHASSFDLWEKQLQQHLVAQYNPEEISKEEHERIFFQTNDLLMDIASAFFTYGKFKDTWDTSECQPHYLGQSLILKSEKMDTSFAWGLQGVEFYLESFIINPENLRYMTDDFWEMLLELKKYGTFEYAGSADLSAKERPFFENKTSTVFQMVRNFMLYQIEKLDGTNYQQPPSMYIGHFTLRWDTNTLWEELLEKASKAFRLLYLINYQLWKIDDLSKKKAARLSGVL